MRNSDLAVIFFMLSYQTAYKVNMFWIRRPVRDYSRVRNLVFEDKCDSFAKMSRWNFLTFTTYDVSESVQLTLLFAPICPPS